MKLVRPISVCLNETYVKVHTAKHSSQDRQVTLAKICGHRENTSGYVVPNLKITNMLLPN